MQIIVSKDLTVKDATNDMIAWAQRELSLDNPEYYKKVQLGKWTGNISPKINLYQKIGRDLILPFGCLLQVYRMFPKASYELHIAPFKPFSYQSNINLYDYQERAVNEALKRKNGILVMPCGSGKTQSGLEIISRLGGRALWLTHTQDLLNQSKDRATSVLDCDKSAFGTITGGRVNISNGITFATVQTMSKLDLAQYRDAWDIIIVDECQHCAGTPTRVTQFYKVINSLSARYKIGLTATPHRADGLEKSMYALLGDTIHEVTKAEVAHTTCPVKVRIRETLYEPDYSVALAGDGTINYANLVKDLIGNEKRFNQILFEINRIVHDGATMVLASRVEYLQRLCDRCDGKAICLSTLGSSKKAKQERKDALKKLNNGEIDCIFATYALAKEGLDVPNLRYVIFATPEKDLTTVMQSAGRVGRKADGKECGTVIDYVDANFSMYKGWLKKRLGYYKKLNYEII